MGAKTWMLVYTKGDARETLRAGPSLDREATLKLAGALFPGEKLAPLEDGDLSSTCPPDDELCIGCFPGLWILSAKECAIDYPSRLPAPFIASGSGGTLTLHVMYSVVDWFAFAQWQNGALTRSLSLSPDSGVMEDIGTRFPFEEPYWAGQHPVGDDRGRKYPLPFHPLDLGEAALREFFGYELEGLIDDTLLDPETVPLAQYKRSRLRSLSRSWWQFWR